MELVDLDGYARSFRNYYRGNAGPKYGIIVDDKPWIVKFPKSTAADARQRVSYTTSPINEYIGSQIYASLGIDTHETMLGLRDGKVVCACRDFRAAGDTLVEFKDIKNSLPDDDPLTTDVPSDGNGTYLADVLRAIGLEPTLRATPGVLERFWDMFVIDAFIRNNDRNNTNWGLLLNDDLAPRLAPVYDNGGCLFDRRAAETNATWAEDARAVAQDSFGTCVSAYVDAGGHHIKPFEYLKATDDADCLAAVARFDDAVSMARVDAILGSIPESWHGTEVLPAGTRRLYSEIFHAHREAIGAAARRAREVLGKGSPRPVAPSPYAASDTQKATCS